MLTASDLLSAYARGVFPMAASSGEDRLYWFNPDPRGILPLGEVHAARSLRRDLRTGNWSARHAPDFDAVIVNCAAREETWINAPLKRLYRELYDQGHAYALEVLRNGELAGGIYGVVLGGAFFGESMFSTQTSGSRMALLWSDWLLRHAGFTLFDTQYLTPHLASMGGREVARMVYRRMLGAALPRQPLPLESCVLPTAQLLLHDITQTS
ncbi:leucyl/phenylalanyl-tRNA--protein transferase [Paracoccus aminophilus]|uniref:Leucyl/phenylalanyl-tRNA--protein transferase n=1 Tax=Paracoccus aminophilus JCM 7686 TaxID=1367847 RepID=S5YTX6_PARAH|nr:leucyl/phenylalanyl-tRNA--protein transferase [Paracoccus aminophilus]AGT08676.1 leucyl/phenylalanyl-tRNA--protein transferase [Paracoccus aminophilus JCM 7686]